MNIRKGILSAIETRLAIDPVNYGVRLRKSLKGYWKMRIGSYRVVYEISVGRIIVHGIGHRDYIYDVMLSRLGK